MTFQLVSLLYCLLAASIRAQFLPFGNGGGMGGGFGSGFKQNQYNQQQHVDPNLMTCINADAQDLQSQIRMTIRPVKGQHGALGVLGAAHHMGLGFGDVRGAINRDQPMDWTVDGLLMPSQVAQKLGTYQVGIFEGGRTFGECKRAALGKVLNTGSGMPLSPFGFGHFSPLNLNPFASMMGGLGGMGGMYGNQVPNGIVSNNAVISTGTTVYSGYIRGLSYNQILGRSMGVCQSIQSECRGLIPYCCSITADLIPASDVFQDVGHGVGGNVVGGMAGVGLNTVGMNGVAGVGMGNTGFVGAQPGRVGAGNGLSLGGDVNLVGGGSGPF